MSLYEGIFTRKSVRRYKREPIDQRKLDEILKFARTLPMLFPGIQVEYQILDCVSGKNRSKYLEGFRFLKAPYYLILTSTKENGYYINAGYLIQQISLYLTARNIGSCCQGAISLTEEVNVNLEMEHVITMAFGESKSDIHRSALKVKRLPEEDTVIYKEEVSDHMKKIIYAARLAPSSMNNQPCRFVVYDNRVHIFCKKNLFISSHISKLKLLDIGVALANMLVVIEEMWIDVEVYRSTKVSSQYFKNYDYIITVKIN